MEIRGDEKRGERGWGRKETVPKGGTLLKEMEVGEGGGEEVGCEEGEKDRRWEEGE